MKKLMLAWLLFSLMAQIGACSHTETPPLDNTAVQSTLLDGPSTAVQLNARYNDNRSRCNNSPSQPAFLCSGVIIRGTERGAGYDVWDPSPNAIARQGISFSYLRENVYFQRFAYSYNNGFIFYPVLSTPSGMQHIEILCAFPIDSGSANREAPGCGKTVSPQVIADSNRCQSQGITTAEAWYTHYNRNIPDYRPHGQCSFDVRDQMNQEGADSFYQSMRAAQMLNHTENNELILKTWGAHIGAAVPIEAFFYLPAGLSQAQQNQVDFHNKTGRSVPIIKLQQNTGAPHWTFVYVAADQRI